MPNPKVKKCRKMLSRFYQFDSDKTYNISVDRKKLLRDLEPPDTNYFNDVITHVGRLKF